MRLGDLDALKNKIKELPWTGDESYYGRVGLHAITDLIDNAPTVELNDKSLEIARKSIELGRKVGKLEGKLERPHGEWIEGFHDHFETLDCSCCGYVRNERHLTLNFCPNCGADMQKDGVE